MDAGYRDDRIMSELSASLDCALEAIDAQGGSLLVLDDDTAELVFVLVAGVIPPDALGWFRIPANSGIAGWVAKQAQPLIANDARSDDRFYPAVDEAFDFKTESVMAVPVMGRGEVLGVLEVVNKGAEGLFVEDDQTLMSLMSCFVGELLYRMSEKETEHRPRDADESG
jgi:signal transduction protein with GAF and PtsI domain